LKGKSAKGKSKGKTKGPAGKSKTVQAKAKAKSKSKDKKESKKSIPEHHGMMIMYHEEHEKARKWFKQISGRTMQICFKAQGPDLKLTNYHAPHAWLNKKQCPSNTQELVYERRQKYFEDLTEYCIEKDDQFVHIALGDANTRLHGRLDGEEDVLGKHIFGRGAEFVKHLPQNDKDHRSLFIAMMKASEHVAIDTFFEKTSPQKSNEIRLGKCRCSLDTGEIC